MKKSLLHCIANCRNCNWSEEDYNTAKEEGRKHALKHNHIVDVEEGYWPLYEGKKEKTKRRK